MTWQIFIAVSVLTYSIAVIVQKLLLKEKTDPMAFSIFFQLLTGLIIGVFGYITTGLRIPNLQPLLINLILMATLYAGANIFIFKALQKIDASEFTIIFSSRSLFTILASSLLIHEGLTGIQILGTLLIIVSVVLVTIKSTKFSLSRFELFALLGAIGFGLATTNDRFILRHVELYSYVFIAFIVPALVTIPIFPKSISNMKIFFTLPLGAKMLGLCIIYAISALTFFMALQASNNSSQIASLNLTSIIITVILSIIILKENKNIIRKIAGSILTAAGVLLLK